MKKRNRRQETAFAQRISAKAEKIRGEILAANTMVNKLRKIDQEDISSLGIPMLERYGLQKLGRRAAMSFLKNLSSEKKNELKGARGEMA